MHVRRRRGIGLGLAAVGLFFCGACHSATNGFYLDEGATEDVGLEVAGADVEVQGRILLFPPGDPLPSRRYTLTPATWIPPEEIVTTLTNVADPEDVGSLTAVLSSDDGGVTFDHADGQLVLADGTRSFHMDRAPQPNFDHYKCLDEPGQCAIATAPPSCTFEPLPGDRTYHVTAVIPFKSADGATAFAENQPGMGSQTLVGTGTCYWARGIPGSGVDCGGVLLRTTVAGDTEGTVTFDADRFSYPPEAIDAVFSFGPAVACPLPPG